MSKKNAQLYAEHKGINEGRIVLHSDLNNFFASVECKKRPYLRRFPVAVCGRAEERHGIVLAKNMIAKNCGVKTGQTIWQARQVCANLMVLEPDYNEYMYYSQKVRQIYEQYSDKVEAFGLDEAWIELTGDRHIKTLKDGYETAHQLRKRVARETGLTVSVGVSDNKVFAKLASDYKKPDAVTLFGPDNYLDKVCNIEVGELLFVGKSTRERLHLCGINTIGQVAMADDAFIRRTLGKNGERLSFDACGFDSTSVSRVGEVGQIKSIGNSTTTSHDLENIEQVARVFHTLCEKVAWRLRSSGFMCRCVSISVRDTRLCTTTHQCVVEPTDNALEIANIAIKLFKERYDIFSPVRSVGVSTTNLLGKESMCQINMFDNLLDKREKRRIIDRTVDEIRKKHGINAVKRAVMCDEQTLDYRDFAFLRERHCVSNSRNF